MEPFVFVYLNRMTDEPSCISSHQPESARLYLLLTKSVVFPQIQPSPEKGGKPSGTLYAGFLLPLWSTTTQNPPELDPLEDSLADIRST